MPKSPLPIKPLKDNVLVRESPQENSSPGGIALPDNRQKNPYRMGAVLSVGPGMSSENESCNSQIPEDVKVGSVVLFHTQSGWDVPWSDGEKYVVVSCRNIEAVVDPEYMAWLKENKKSS